MKKIARYLLKAERLCWEYRTVDGEIEWVDVMVDSDLAGDTKTRRSTSGGMVVVGGVAIKLWSRTQKGRSLSSAEAEYYAIVTGSAEDLAIQALAAEMGWTLGVRVHADTSGAKVVASRRGSGRMANSSY